MPSEGISVVVPVYNSQETLTPLVTRLQNALQTCTDDFEIILIDDQSSDQSWSVMQEIAQDYQKIIAVRLSRNFGQHYAITAGLDMTRGEWTVVMDCDLQDKPEEIPRLLEEARKGYDIVIARRIARKDPLRKRFSSWLFYKIFSILTGYKTDRKIGAFRLMRRPVVDAFCKMRETFRLFGGMINWLGFKTAFVDVEHAPRFAGKTSYTLVKLMKLSIDGIISFSNRPLYISVGIGISMCIFAVIYVVYHLLRYFIVDSFGVPGWLSTIIISTFIGGLILLNLGIIGIYIGRMYDQTKHRPLYVIERVVVGKDLSGEKTSEQGKNTSKP